MTYHQTLLATVFESTCKKLANGAEITVAIKLHAAYHTIKAYQEMLESEPDSQNKLDGLIAARQFQRVKAFELSGAVT